MLYIKFYWIFYVISFRMWYIYTYLTILSCRTIEPLSPPLDLHRSHHWRYLPHKHDQPTHDPTPLNPRHAFLSLLCLHHSFGHPISSNTALFPSSSSHLFPFPSIATTIETTHWICEATFPYTPAPLYYWLSLTSWLTDDTRSGKIETHRQLPSIWPRPIRPPSQKMTSQRSYLPTTHSTLPTMNCVTWTSSPCLPCPIPITIHWRANPKRHEPATIPIPAQQTAPSSQALSPIEQNTPAQRTRPPTLPPVTLQTLLNLMKLHDNLTQYRSPRQLPQRILSLTMTNRSIPPTKYLTLQQILIHSPLLPPPILNPVRGITTQMTQLQVNLPFAHHPVHSLLNLKIVLPWHNPWKLLHDVNFLAHKKASRNAKEIMSTCSRELTVLISNYAQKKISNDSRTIGRTLSTTDPP